MLNDVFPPKKGREVKVLTANAGSGKTTWLINRICEELKERRPEEIAFVTFTRKGVNEGLTRVCNKFYFSADELPYFRTIHSLCYHALGLKYKNLFQPKHQREFNAKYGYRVKRDDLQGKAFMQKNMDTLCLDYYDLERCGGMTSRGMMNCPVDKDYMRGLVYCYEEFKRSKELLDFTDMLLLYLKQGEALPCEVAMIDEAQDLNVLQWVLLGKAFENAKRIYIAGDDKQSLYKFNGARPDIFIEFTKQYNTTRLIDCHRNSYAVFRLADAVVQFLGQKSEGESKFCPENGAGQIRRLPTTEQVVDLIAPPIEDSGSCQWYLLSRNTCFLSRYTSALEADLIPYWDCNGFFMGGAIMERLLDYYGYSKSGYKTEESKKAFQEKFGIDDFNKPFTETTLFSEDRKWVYYSYISRYGLPTLRAMSQWKPQVYVGTVHSVKGGEADNVALLLDNTMRTYGERFEDLDDEMRCFYVAVTRARNNLYLVNSENDSGLDDIVDMLNHQFELGI